MWLPCLEMVRGMCYCTQCLRTGPFGQILNWGTGKRRVLHQLFNPSAEAKPATDGKCPQRLMHFWKVQRTHLEAGC